MKRPADDSFPTQTPCPGDVNGFCQESDSRFEMSVEDGYRSTSARAYLHSQPARENLDIRLG